MRKGIVLFGLSLALAFVVRAEKASVFFVHGANVSEQDARAWASEMFKRLWQAGANMEFCPVAWESDIGPSYNYQANVANAFVTARRLAPLVNAVPGRRVVIAHSLGTLVAAAAIQDYGMQVDKFIMLNSAIPSEAFEPSLVDYSPENHLVHVEWRGYPSRCWAARWHEFYAGNANDARGKLTWKGRFSKVKSIAVNFYSSGDEVLELYTNKHNPSWYNGFSPSGNWGDRYSWHKQEIWKGRKSLLGFMGTTDWSGWGFRTRAMGLAKVWSESEANAVVDFAVFKTNTVFCLYPPSITNAANSRLVIDAHLAQGIPALSPPTGMMNLTQYGLPSFDMNSLRANTWPRGSEFGDMADRFLHSDVKNVAYFFVHPVFQKIVEIGGLR